MRSAACLAAAALLATPLPGKAIAAAETIAARSAPATGLYDLAIGFRSDDGRPLRLAGWRGRPAIVAMDHTQSLVICSDTIRRLRAVSTAAERLGQHYDYLVISLDPEADTPEQWQRYKRYFDVDRPGWHFLTASAADTAALVERLGIRIRYDQGYRFHEVKLFRVDADGRIVRTLEGYDRDSERFLR